MVVCFVQREFLICFPFVYSNLLSGSFFFIDLVDNCICDARLLAHVQRELERCTMIFVELPTVQPGEYFNFKKLFGAILFSSRPLSN